MNPNLQTTYLGLPLTSPLIVSSSPLARNVDNLLRMEDAGAGAVVMFSLFEEQINAEIRAVETYWEAGTDSFGEALTYFPKVESYPVGVVDYLNLISDASERCDMPIIGSLNGTTPEGWTGYAREIEQAGAKALELNIYYLPTDLTQDGQAVEARYLEVVKQVKSEVNIPVAVKLNPYFSSVGHMAHQLSDAGADGLVLFNRFYQPDFDIDRLQIVNSLDLSSSSEIRLPLMWLGILHGKLPVSLAATTGVHTGTDLIKYLLAGADAVMTTSALLKNGIGHLTTMLDELKDWMVARNFGNLDEMRGMLSQQRINLPGQYDRANYIRILQGYK